MEIFKKVIKYLRKKFEPKPGVVMDDVNFLIKPYIGKRGEKYFLIYQIAKSEPPPLVRVLYSRKTDNKAYYFFSVAISHIEQGNLVKRDISIDSFNAFAEKNSIYWLNSDGSEIPLQIKMDD